MTKMQSDIIPLLSAIAGSEAVLSGDSAAPYCTDWRGRYSGKALAAVFPSNTLQVAGLVKLCGTRRIAIVPQGGNTSLCGASVPLTQGEQIVLNLSRMNRVRAIDPPNYTMTVEAGCKLADVRDVAEKNNRYFPLGLTATQKICEIGGNLSTNAGGVNVLRYGNARDLALGLEVVLPDGRVWDGLRALRKDNTGYDLKHLFIGAEGTLGIITAAVLKLFPLPQTEATACVAARDAAAAVALLVHLRAMCGDKISAFEFVSRPCLELVFKHIPDTIEPFERKHGWIVLIQLAETSPAPLDGILNDAIKSFGKGVIEFDIANGKDPAERWWKLRKSISEAQKREGISIKHDIAVPVSRVAEFIERADAALLGAFPGVRIVAFGHMGDGNIHYNVSMPDASQNKSFVAQQEGSVNRMVYEVVRELDGSISAEHGLGQLKRGIIRDYKAPLELELMRIVKQALDPHDLMNPGKVL